jgi:precorrin-6x reductase
MAALLQGAALCVDATHPYAVEATKNSRENLSYRHLNVWKKSNMERNVEMA